MLPSQIGTEIALPPNTAIGRLTYLLNFAKLTIEDRADIIASTVMTTLTLHVCVLSCVHVSVFMHACVNRMCLCVHMCEIVVVVVVVAFCRYCSGQVVRTRAHDVQYVQDHLVSPGTRV